MFNDRRAAANGNGVAVGAERRVHPRYAFTAAAEALDARSNSRMSARVSDLARGGCYVDTFCPFPVKTGVKIRITREKKCFTADAKVVSSKLGMGMGLQFTQVEPQQLCVLEQWLGELNGTVPIEFEPPNENGLRLAHAALNHGSGHNPHKEPGYVVAELIVALMRKGSLPEEEGRVLLGRLLKQ